MLSIPHSPSLASSRKHSHGLHGVDRRSHVIKIRLVRDSRGSSSLFSPHSISFLLFLLRSVPLWHVTSAYTLVRCLRVPRTFFLPFIISLPLCTLFYSSFFFPPRHIILHERVRQFLFSFLSSLYDISVGFGPSRINLSRGGRTSKTVTTFYLNNFYPLVKRNTRYVISFPISV